MTDSVPLNEVFLLLSPTVLRTRLGNGMVHEFGKGMSVIKVYRNIHDGHEYQATHVVRSEKACDELMQELPDAVLMLRANMDDVQLVQQGKPAIPKDRLDCTKPSIG